MWKAFPEQPYQHVVFYIPQTGIKEKPPVVSYLLYEFNKSAPSSFVPPLLVANLARLAELGAAFPSCHAPLFVSAHVLSSVFAGGVPQNHKQEVLLQVFWHKHRSPLKIFDAFLRICRADLLSDVLSGDKHTHTHSISAATDGPAVPSCPFSEVKDCDKDVNPGTNVAVGSGRTLLFVYTFQSPFVPLSTSTPPPPHRANGAQQGASSSSPREEGAIVSVITCLAAGEQWKRERLFTDSPLEAD